MPIDIAQRIIDFLFLNASKFSGKQRHIAIGYWGGEPLLEWDLLKQITLYAENKSKKNSIDVSFGGTTNGTLLTEEKLDFIDEHKLFFMVSIDGKKNSHDLFRKFKNGRGSHDIVMQNMRGILKRLPNYRARISLTADRIEHFFEDMKYLFDFGFKYLMFSPVYESHWTEKKWKIFEQQSYRLVDYMTEQKANGKPLMVEHFQSYCRNDKSPYPCGAGRFYVGFDIDGAIYPCHRFNKFDDNRPWQEKETCIGHVDYGITKPEFRNQFIDWKPKNCDGCERFKDTPCHGSCYAVSWDFMGDIRTAYPGACQYVEAQKKVSSYFAEKFKPLESKPKTRSCVCYNMCYLQNSPDQLAMLDRSGITCLCYQTHYLGNQNSQIK